MLHQEISDRHPLTDSDETSTVQIHLLTIAVFAVSSDADIVTLVVSVGDSYGCPVSGLAVQDFTVTTSSGSPVPVRTFAEDANLRGSYRMQVVPDTSAGPLDSLRVDLARPQTGLHGRGVVNFNHKRSL